MVNAKVASIIARHALVYLHVLHVIAQLIENWIVLVNVYVQITILTMVAINNVYHVPMPV